MQSYSDDTGEEEDSNYKVGEEDKDMVPPCLPYEAEGMAKDTGVENVGTAGND